MLAACRRTRPVLVRTQARAAPVRLSQLQRQAWPSPGGQIACLSAGPLRPASSSSQWTQRHGRDMYFREKKVLGLRARSAFKLLEIDKKYRLFNKNDVVVDLGYAPGSWSQVAVERTQPRGRVLGIDIIPAQPPKGVSTIQGNFLSPSVQGMVKQFLLDDRRRYLAERAAAKAAVAKTAVVEEDDAEDVEGHAEDGLELPDGEEMPEAVDRPSYIDAERMVARETIAAAATEDVNNTAKEHEAMQKFKSEDMLVDVVLSDMCEPWPQTQGFSVNSLSNPYIRLMNTSGNAFRDHIGSMDLCHAALSFANDTLKYNGNFVCKYYSGMEDKKFETKLKKLFKHVHRMKPDASRKESKEAYFVAMDRKPIRLDSSIQSTENTDS